LLQPVNQPGIDHIHTGFTQAQSCLI